MPKEQFMPSYNYPNHYEVSNHGNMRRIKSGKGTRFMVPFKLPKKPYSGYFRPKICIDGTSKTILLHREIAETFIRPLLSGECINHLDGDKLNNNICNLEITTITGNNHHARYVLKVYPRGPRQTRSPSCKVTAEQAVRIINATRRSGELLALANEFSLSLKSIYNIRGNRNRCSTTYFG
jgi:hypothetical protein